MTPAQCRAARALVDLSREDLASATKVPASTIADFERGRLFISDPGVTEALRRTLEDLGVVFTGSGEEVGVRRRKMLER
jgi:transcriptional regulator with XRE-family HTH domain